MQGSYARKLLAQCLTLLMMVSFLAMVGCDNDDDNEFDADVAFLPDTTSLNSANVRRQISPAGARVLDGLTFPIDAAAFSVSGSGSASTNFNGLLRVSFGDFRPATGPASNAAFRVEGLLNNGTPVLSEGRVFFNQPAGTFCRFDTVTSSFPTDTGLAQSPVRESVSFTTCRIGVGGDDVVRERVSCNGAIDASEVPGTMVLVLTNPVSGVTFTSTPPTEVEVSIDVNNNLCVNGRDTDINLNDL